VVDSAGSISHGYILFLVHNVSKILPTDHLLGLADTANNFLLRIVPAATKFFEDMENFKEDPILKVVGECPVRAIREVQDDGTDIYIGDIGISRCNHGELIGLNELDWENGPKCKEENDALKVGDLRILWVIGGTCA